MWKIFLFATLKLSSENSRKSCHLSYFQEDVKTFIVQSVEKAKYTHSFFHYLHFYLLDLQMVSLYLSCV